MLARDSFAYVFDGRGGAAWTPADGSALPHRGPADPGFSWQHLRRDNPETAGLLTALGLDHFVIEALTADETRPRCTVHGHSVVLNLRGVNLDEGAEPEDMISVRFWLEAQRVVGVWVRPLQAIDDFVAAIDRDEAPVSPGDLIARLGLRLADRAEPSIAALNEQIDTLEEAVLEQGRDISRVTLSGLRRSSIVLRRYFVPQRDALTTLEIEDLAWMRDTDRARLREAAERVRRFGEELDAIRDRAQIVHDQIIDQRAERMNRQMLLLSVVAAIFLPLGLVTGLLGINVGGVPGADNPWAFAIVTIGLLATGLGLFLWFRAIGMFK
ncbi:MAG: zinc transporter ZntB [Flavimaricola sp.]|nr:zinc transporter ZntB [Flavimaricola sp.]